jgi:DNA-binding transcriptional MerR regulator
MYIEVCSNFDFNCWMPLPRSTLNGFTASEVESVSGLSRPMIDYLNRYGFLRAAYAPRENARGRVRYYSYRDLVVARLIQHLREGGVQLGRLKATAERMSDDGFWAADDEPAAGSEWIVSDGRNVDLQDATTLLERIGGDGRSSFAFVVNVGRLRDEVRDRIASEKRQYFSMAIAELQFAVEERTGRGAASKRAASGRGLRRRPNRTRKSTS